MTLTEDIRTIEVKLRLTHEIEELRREVKRSDDSLLTEVSLLSDRLQELRRAAEGNRNRLNHALHHLAEVASLELAELTVTYDFGHGQKITSRGGTMFTLTDTQQVHARATFKDVRGNPTEADMANIQWSSSDETKITATPDTDGSGGCTFAAVGPLTDPAAPVQVSVTDGNLTVTDTIAVTASEATTVGIEFETASPEQPPAPAGQ